MIESTCDEFHELAPELALDILPGDERAAAVAHLEHCAACCEHLASLTAVGDGLLGLVPSHEPSSGFETRVLERLRPAGHAHRRRRTLVAAATAAAALVAAAGVGGTAADMALRQSAPQNSQPTQGAPAAPQLRTGTFTVAGHPAGQIFLYHGSPPWTYMSVTTDQPFPTAICQLQMNDGTFVPVGQIDLSGKYAHWGGPVRTDPAAVTGARIVTADGTLIATAKFGA